MRLSESIVIKLFVEFKVLNIIEVKTSHLFNYFPRNDAEDAIDALDGRKYDGRELSVQYARYVNALMSGLVS